MNKFELLGVNVSATNLKETVVSVMEAIERKKKIYVCVCPVSTVIDCRDSADYRRIVNNADIVTPDGMPVVISGKIKGFKNISRTYGPDLMLDLCDLSQDKGYRHYFFGGKEDNDKLLVESLRKRFPKLIVAGCFSPGERKLGELEDSAIIEQINTSNCDVLWVGLGSPKQDYWMANHREKLNAPVIIGVGAAFDFLSGAKPQAPLWMQRSGLEWLFRLCREPKRLWRRYLIG
ncbi:MAG: WecB/TagA/CpsF family glycosyltransferase, partial [Candidatus Omnitrophica bacterium]|nr:WecB/TagA/CpsF family glycosyltransferase [Candidatus Omnitrophota bacterium]